MNPVTWLLGGVCHQMPEHSLIFQGQPLPLCSRCSGMFVAICLVLVVLWRRGRRSGLPPWSMNLGLSVLLVVWALDGINSLVSELAGRTLFYPPNNTLRLMTGSGCGLALGVWLYPILHDALWPASLREPATSTWRALVSSVSGVAVYVALLLGWHDAPYWLVASLVSTATVSVFVLVNTALAGLVWPLRPCDSLKRQVLARFLCGVALALFEMIGMALLRSWLVA